MPDLNTHQRSVLTILQQSGPQTAAAVAEKAEQTSDRPDHFNEVVVEHALAELEDLGLVVRGDLRTVWHLTEAGRAFNASP
jgi:hypothetical protein